MTGNPTTPLQQPDCIAQPGGSTPSLLLRFFDSFLQERSIRWLLALGVFILLGSSLLLVTARWQEMSLVWKYLIFLGYTAALFGGGEWVYHRLALRRTGIVLYALTVLLVPILFLALGWGIAVENSHLDVLLRLTLGTATLGFSVLAAMRIFGRLLRGTAPTFVASYLILATAGALLPLAPDAGRPWLALALWGVFAAGTIKVNGHVFWLNEERRKPRIFGFFPIALLGGQFLALYLLFAAPHVTLDWLGVGCVLVAVPVLAAGDSLARVFQQRTGDLVRPLPWSLLVPLGVGLTLCAAGVCLAGTPLLESLDRGHAMVFAAGIGSGLMALVARRTRKQVFVWAMLVGLTLTYRFVPTFGQELVRLVLQRGAELVREERVPLAFYGLTCLPLVAAAMAGAWWLRGRSDLFAQPLRHYAIGLACLLLALSLGHPKAVFPVSLVMTGVFAGQAVLFRQRTLAWPAVLAWVLAAFGLSSFLTGVLAWHVPEGFRLASMTAAAASLLIAGRWLDPLLVPTLLVPTLRVGTHAGDAPRPVAATIRYGAVQIVSLLLTLGLAAYWMAQVLVPAGEASWPEGILIAAMLIVHCRRWRRTALRDIAPVPLVIVNWQALTMILLFLQPHRMGLFDLELADLALPIACAASASVLVWQTFAWRVAAPSGYLVHAHLGALRVLTGAAIAYSLTLDVLAPGGALLALGVFAFAVVAEALSACRRGSETRTWLAIALAATGVGYLAWFRVIHFGSGLGMFVVLCVALLLWLFKESIVRSSAFRRCTPDRLKAELRTAEAPNLTALVRPLTWTAFTMPLLVVGLGVYRHFTIDQPRWLGVNSLALLLAGGFYFWRGLEERRKRLVLLSAAILNVALVLLWRERAWSDPQFFMIPIGITVLALVQLFKNEIAERFHDPIRYAGALVILVSPVFHIGTSWLHVFTLMLASVGIVLVAIGLRVRALMYAGAAFLLADLVTMVVRGSMENANVLWLAGLALGSGVLALGGACERNRESLLQRIRVLTEALKQWE